ncbi:inner membrane CreD family protein [candidate division WOR-3 bacterium]|nr:inner membrane CreD family protein [candidate division WOR-3 bacterium]MCK4528549.1 inner membrane CreD family protein [candidate division WOR-3 bacterium]
MRKHIGPLILIFIFISIAWIILGGVITTRTHSQDIKLKQTVSHLWGTVQRQQAPYVYYQTKEEKRVTTVHGSETIIERKIITTNHPINIEESNIKVDLRLEHRKKGLLWYSTYKVVFHGKYTILNKSLENRDIFFEYTFPTIEGVYDNFSLLVAGKKVKDLKPIAGTILKKLNLDPGKEKEIEIAYESQGMDEWWYIFGGGVSHIQNFKLSMVTDFDEIDFPENSISPTKKEKRDKGWELTWKYSDLISGIQIGMVMPQRVNPGPFVSRVTFFAPISLFLFLVLMFIIATLKGIKIHPMNYFFVSAAFFSFHLLLAYLADHIDIHLSLVIASLVSIFLVISYMRLVIGMRFAFLETGISQLVYLVLFSYTFFLTGYTGLSITILCIVTLFVLMQLTGKIDWENQFNR